MHAWFGFTRNYKWIEHDVHEDEVEVEKQKNKKEKRKQ